ncbi:MAG: hypothetical protein J5800_03560 [Spirochaetales bacterium]|nr:hypothetical protein [Spirochaetales bacterium]
MTQVTVKKDILSPSTGHHSIIPNQYHWRKTGEFIGGNTIAIMNPQEAVWWNRPLESDVMCKLESDGLYSYNLPFLGQRDVYKTGYNILLAKNSIPVAIHVKLDGWTDDEIERFYNLSYKVLWDSLVELGVGENHLSIERNDMLYDGRKFAGGEKAVREGVFSEDLVITTHYLPEKDVFSRLTGKYAKSRGITGICEECPWITMEELRDKLLLGFGKALLD